MPGFRFNAKCALLTYSQVGSLDGLHIVRLLHGLGAKLVLGREAHEDGGTHFHAFIRFDKRPNFKRANCFDVEGFHPNISVTKGSPRAGYDYATKDGDIIHQDFERPESAKDKRAENYSTILNSADEEEFWRNAKELEQGLVLKSYISIRAYARDTYAAKEDSYTTPEGYVFKPEIVAGLSEWVEEYLRGHTLGGKLSCPTHRGIPPSLRSVALQAQGDPCPMLRGANFTSLLGVCGLKYWVNTVLIQCY